MSGFKIAINLFIGIVMFVGVMVYWSYAAAFLTAANSMEVAIGVFMFAVLLCALVGVGVHIVKTFITPSSTKEIENE